jgi:hypothetical protein
MHIWFMLFAVLLIVLIAGVAVLHVPGVLMQSLGNQPMMG